MQHVIDKIAAYHGPAFRNIQSIHHDYHAFDDLINNDEAKKFAFESSLNLNEKANYAAAQYNAIDYIFQQSSWLPSRFCDGSFPTWYGSLDLETTFHESAFHWHRKFITSPTGFSKYNKPIKTRRSVYSVTCEAILIDFRNQSTSVPELIEKDFISYAKTQPIGKQIHDQGIPGIISHSARHDSGDNIIIFRPDILSNASHDKDYLYIHEPNMPTIVVREAISNKKVTAVDIQ